MSTPEPYVYRLKAVAKVVDGDTLDLDLDLGFSLVLRQRVRLLGLDAPEIRSKDAAEKVSTDTQKVLTADTKKSSLLGGIFPFVSTMGWVIAWGC
jgi:endonuclease YncB( thermonuclease family)